MKNKLKMGIEIEAIVNNSINKINKGGYHNGKIINGLPGWKAENDGSLIGYEYMKKSNPVEFVSNIIKTKKKLKNSLKSFKQYISKNGRYKLSECLCFNNSCGVHIHISINDKIYFSKIVMFETFMNLRKEFIKRIRKSSIASKLYIINNYGRTYSKKLRKIKRWHKCNRNSEFNFLSEDEGKGIEWRSPNMYGIKTWKEFDTFWNIIIKCLDIFLKKSLKYQNIKNFTFENQKKEIKKREDNNIRINKSKREDNNIIITRNQNVQH